MQIETALKDFARRFNNNEFIISDPVQFPHRYQSKTDIEISAFVAAWMAYGNRKAFIKVLETIHNEFNSSPVSYIMNKGYLHHRDNASPLYRFYKRNDFYCLCNVLNDIYSKNANMEDDVRKYVKDINFQSVLLYFCERFSLVNGIPQNTLSACKRLCMLLRWLVRKDGIVDLGIWNILTPKDLIIPVDTHVYQTARSLGITDRKSVDMRTAVEITNFLVKIFPDDPVLGDFSLYGAGVNAALKKQ
jgi:uncharacterized protein (TIGR02757 family)